MPFSSASHVDNCGNIQSVRHFRFEACKRSVSNMSSLTAKIPMAACRVFALSITEACGALSSLDHRQRHALGIGQKTLGEKHPYTRQFFNNLAVRPENVYVASRFVCLHAAMSSSNTRAKRTQPARSKTREVDFWLQATLRAQGKDADPEALRRSRRIAWLLGGRVE